MKLTVIFDGECGVCTRTIRYLRDRDADGVLTFRPCQSLDDRGFRGVLPADCRRSVWAIASDGRTAQGSDAAFLILAALWSNWWPWRLGTLPGIRQIGQNVYQLVARNRRRLPGDTPWCQQHPEDCDPARWYEGGAA